MFSETFPPYKMIFCYISFNKFGYFKSFADLSLNYVIETQASDKQLSVKHTSTLFILCFPIYLFLDDDNSAEYDIKMIECLQF